MEAGRYILAGGGTGGHLFPGIAVANAVLRAEPDASIVFLTTTRALDGQLLSQTPFERIPQPVRPLSTERTWTVKVPAAPASMVIAAPTTS